MHYVKTPARVQIFMHDLNVLQQDKVLVYLNKHKIDYRYKKKQSCISLPLKHEPVAKYVLTTFNRK